MGVSNVKCTVLTIIQTRRYLKWGLDQMLVLRESDANIRKKMGCPILNDNED